MTSEHINFLKSVITVGVIMVGMFLFLTYGSSNAIALLFPYMMLGASVALIYIYYQFSVKLLSDVIGNWLAYAFFLLVSLLCSILGAWCIYQLTSGESSNYIVMIIVFAFCFGAASALLTAAHAMWLDTVQPKHGRN